MNDVMASLQQSLRDAGLDLQMKPAFGKSGLLFPKPRDGRTAGGFWHEPEDLAQAASTEHGSFELVPQGLRATWRHHAQTSNKLEVVSAPLTLVLLTNVQTGALEGYVHLLSVTPVQPKTTDKRWCDAMKDVDVAFSFAKFITQTCDSTEGLFRRSPTVFHVFDFEMRDAAQGAGMAVLKTVLHELGKAMGATVASIYVSPSDIEWVSRLETTALLEGAPRFHEGMGKLVHAYEDGLGAKIVAVGDAERSKLAVYGIDAKYSVWFGDTGRWCVLEPDKAPR